MATSVTEVKYGTMTGKKCAAFDMDDTLLWGPRAYINSPAKLKELHEKGYNIIIFSNQLKPRMSDNVVKKKLQQLRSLFDIPMHLFLSREDDECRKPNTGMIDLVPLTYGPIEFFCGDAAGREGDHSDRDKILADSAGLLFFTPEEFFPPYPILSRENVLKQLDQTNKSPVMVLFIGLPASGKSTLASRMDKFGIVSRDKFKTMDKCTQAARNLLSGGNNVVIDNLNTKASDREKFIQIGKAFNATIIIVWFSKSIAGAKAWNIKRTNRVPDVVFYTYRKNFEMPSMEEGADNIFVIAD